MAFREIKVSASLCRNRVPSNSPDYGAIFMASNSTRKECFEREIFGLPSEYADFVMKVKNGMPLFLFDFQERMLYGVFEATSDGAMNIVPDAYRSTSNRKFPAQVRFSTFWHCDPLPENVFGDAIKENYFKQFKFNLGLSRDQVGRLLFLFEKRMLKIPNPPVREKKKSRVADK
ncbi:B2 protein-like [Chenopodium quinoa]|uniref:B2 protein-like n=1 Tax=Chenopodium quinoa TaxID=63459 RepID=UPI000B76DB69|nr:B2 protein-like [Chenopodium quinoa]